MQQVPMRKAKNCRICHSQFFPLSTMSRTCSIPCALTDNAHKKVKAFDAVTRERKRAIKTRQQWLQEAQKSFNAYIRARDRGLPCISCGALTGQFHAGHYRPTSTQSVLRFNEFNVNAQCATCNNHKSGNLTGYRIGLIGKIGTTLVEWLDLDHKGDRPDIEQLKWIKKHYQQKTKELHHARAN